MIWIEGWIVREQTFSDAKCTSFYCLCLFNINSYVYVDCNIDKKLYKFSLYMFSCIVFVTLCLLSFKYWQGVFFIQYYVNIISIFHHYTFVN